MAAPVDANAHAEPEDVYYWDKLFCQSYSFRYILQNEYEGTLKDDMRQWIEEIHFGNSSKGPGPSCSCKLKRGIKCGDESCTLRALRLECPASCGNKCRNHIFSDDAFPDNLQIASVDGYGLSLVPTAVIEGGTPLLEFVGKIQPGRVRVNQMHALPLYRFRNKMAMYVNQDFQANESRFVWHAPEPNCEIQEWIVGRELRLLLISTKRIQVNEALTIRFPQRDVDPCRINEMGFLPQQVDFEEAWQPDAEIPDREAISNRRPSLLCGPPLEPDAEPLRSRRSRPYKCRVLGCSFRYKTEEEIMDHWEKTHEATAIPEFQDIPAEERPEEDKDDLVLSRKSS